MLKFFTSYEITCFSSCLYVTLFSNINLNRIIFSDISQSKWGWEHNFQPTNSAQNETARQLITSLHLHNRSINQAAILQLLPDANTDAFTFDLFNGIFVSITYSFLPAFGEVSSQIYRSDVSNFDFNDEETTNSINTFIAFETKNEIQNIINPNVLSSSTQTILVNSLYVKGKWVTPFQQKKFNCTFHLPNGSTKQVPMMNGQRSSWYK